MRYIAVFTLFSLPVAKEFSSVGEAQNRLLEAQRDLDSSPLGLYDALTNEVIIYPYEFRTVQEVDEDLIIRLARNHIERIS